MRHADQDFSVEGHAIFFLFPSFSLIVQSAGSRVKKHHSTQTDKLNKERAIKTAWVKTLPYSFMLH